MLDFQKRKKKYLNITLHDGTKLRIPTPTMDLFDDINEMANDPQSVQVDDLRQIAKAVLATNRDKVQITDEQLEEFDFDDMHELLIQYSAFIKEVLSDPNLNSPIAR